jgi:hypothetical protein
MAHDELYKLLIELRKDLGDVKSSVATLPLIHEQVQKTNGRVTTLEEKHTTLATKVYTTAGLIGAGVTIALNRILP